MKGFEKICFDVGSKAQLFYPQPCRNTQITAHNLTLKCGKFPPFTVQQGNKAESK